MEIIKKCSFIYLIVILVAIALISLSCLISPKAIEENVIDAYELLKTEGNYPSNYENKIGFYDNFTNAIYLNIMILQDANNPFISGISNYWNLPLEEDDGPIQRLEYGIKRTYDNKVNEYPVTSYSNYWLCSIFIVKLMLCFFSIGDIRYIFYVVGAILAIGVAIRIKDRIDQNAMIAFLLSFVVLCSIYNISCFQAASDIFILEIFSLLMLADSRQSKKKGVLAIVHNNWGGKRKCLFFLCGMLNNILSFLYAPIMAANFLIIVMYILDEKENYLVKNKNAFLCAFCWAVGYVLSAITKQILCLIVLGEQIGFGKFLSWSSGGPKKYLYAWIVPLHVFIISKPILISFFSIVIFFFIANVFIKKKRLFFKGFTIKRVTIYIIMSCFMAVFYHEILKSAVGHSFYVQNYFGLVFVCFYMFFLWISFSKEH